MAIYWSEITIGVPGVGNSTGDAARQLVVAELPELAPPDDPIATLTWNDRQITGELVITVLRKVAAERGKNFTIRYRRDATIVARAPDVFDKYNIRRNARREQENALRSAHHPYVIIGCGAAAIVNHTTLRQTEWGRRRVGNSRIIHVGFEDPWSHYNQHEMGQFPQLLGLPGYENRPDLGGDEPIDEPRDSTKFANNTRQETARLRARLQALDSDLEIFPYCAVLIQPRGVTVNDDLLAALVAEGLDLEELTAKLDEEHPDTWGRYRLLLADTDGDIGWGYARYIDICTGAGKPRSVTAAMVGPDTYEAVRTRIWQPPESWDEDLRTRPIMTGTEGLYVESDWDGEKRYCIMGAGGVGVNMIERARDTNKWADWLATGTLHGSFPIARNDILLRHPHTWNVDHTQITAPGLAMGMGDLGDGRNDQLALLDPARERWRFGQGSDIRTAVVEGETVLVTFAASVRNNTYTQVSVPARRGDPVVAQVRDWWEQDSPLTAGGFPYSNMAQAQNPPYVATPNRYDRLIRASGQDIRDVGQAEKVAAHFDFEPIAAVSDGRMVGLQTNDESVRILGAAGTGNAQMADTQSRAHKKMVDYHGSLPVQGQIMFVGFVFSSLNVATANHYFDPGNRKKALATDDRADTPVEVNTNLNTMSVAELSTLLGDAPLARKIVRVRQVKQEGFMSAAELENAIEQLEAADAQVAPVKLLAHGWEKSLNARGLLPVVNSMNAVDIQSKVQDVRLTEWIIYVRGRRPDDYAHKDVLITDLRKRWSELYERNTSTTALAPGWQAKLVVLEAFYRPADPYVF